MRIELQTAGLPAKEEILEMAKGEKQIVLAGAEPLEYAGIIDIVKELQNEDIRIETDGQNLDAMVESLKAAGLNGVHINVNTMRHSRYAKSHDGKELKNVIDGINKAIDNQLYVRLNVSLEKGFSEEEVLDFVQLTFYHNYDIVFMPTIPYEEIKEKLKIRPVEGDFGDVEMFKYAIGKGKIGFLKEA